jgi:hypothetical protein
MDDVTDKNLYAYCDNNPIMREDSSGDFWGELALAGGETLGFFGSIGGVNFWNPAGWTILGIATIVTAGVVWYKIYNAARSERPYNQEAEHNSKTPSKKNKHQEGQSRKRRDKGREKGDIRRTRKSKRYIIPKK